MLEQMRGGGYVIRCERCRAELALPEARDLDEARLQGRGAGWYEQARAGRGRARWVWQCPACAPRGPTGPTRLGGSGGALP
jgi:hypothetical protein